MVETKELVFNNGFSGTSIDQILDKTGITKGAFFYHFKTKNALAKALIETYAHEDKAHLEWALQETESLKETPLKRLLQFVQLFIDTMSNTKEVSSCLYASYTHEPSQFDQETLAVVSNAILNWRHTFMELLNDTLANNSIKKGVDIESLADQFTVIFEGTFIISKALNDPTISAKQLQHFKNYLELLFEKNS
ncbi:TetR/AcrR family transcriptional regulator [Muricauda sp. CAU 1633]|uniref:TetR/AcrR family transcriptional regulator n=1 Tax=Allomuricauda sp. CAU 1633 TaxID=2816036 RepID=UPI001A8D8F7C|nr:helix-turn-helix domain-containing protein [Muricauda sp. CAU 1633]MBO0324109.1 TetR/AcrR family transcriptional regulator [Muricauda sp. CAU 1633]